MKKKFLLLVGVIFYMTNANAQNGLQMFDNRFVHEIKISTSYAGLFDSLESHYSTTTFDATYIMCSVQMDGVTVDSIGLKEKGASSNFWPGVNGEVKKPLKIDFGNYVHSQLYDGLNKINLSNCYYDPSMMHNAIVFKAMNDAGVAAPRTSYAKVYLNNIYWGLYMVIEQVDKKFLANHFPDHNGNLYEGLSATSALNWLGSNKSLYLEQYEQQLKQSGDSSYADLIHLCDIVNNSGTNYYDSVTTYFDMNSFLKSMAIDYLFRNSDGLVTSGHNFYIYHSTTDNKFYWIPWDANQTFDYVNYKLLDPIGNSKPIFYNSIQNSILRNVYFDKVCDISSNIVTSSNLFGFIDSTYSLIRNALVTDTNMLYPLMTFDNVIDFNTIFSPLNITINQISLGIKPTILVSKDSSYAELLAYGYNCAFVTNTSELLKDEFVVYPNPFSDKFTVENKLIGEECEIILYDINSKVLLQEKFINSITLNTETIANGIYFYRIVNGSEQINSGKIIKH